MTNSRKPYYAENLLFRKLSINNEPSTPTTPSNSSNSSTEKGFLEVIVFDNKTQEPISCALVQISKITITGQYQERAQGLVIYKHRTDINGKVSNVELPVINELTSKDFYAISVISDEYYSAFIFRAQVYPNITSTFNVYLNHITTGVNQFEILIQPTMEQIHQR
jgi:hypothetical protein